MKSHRYHVRNGWIKGQKDYVLWDDREKNIPFQSNSKSEVISEARRLMELSQMESPDE